MEKILLGHGSGGRLMHQLIREYFVPEFELKELNDSAIIEMGYDVIARSMALPSEAREPGAKDSSLRSEQAPQSHNPEIASPSARNDNRNKFRLAFTTDSYVVSPIFFPGGNIGDLAVNGTVNDLSVVGAAPLCLAAGFIIEEGFPSGDLKAVLSSMNAAAKNAGVKIVAGDTKVVDKGKGDGIFINTSGIGLIPEGVNIGANNVRKGDRIIISGYIGNHGVAVMSGRNGIVFEPPVLSDTAPLNGLIKLMLDASAGIKMMRDPTRGGIATTLKEIAEESGCCITISEGSLPVSGGVRGACDLLGLDPLYIANEGIVIAVAAQDAAERLVEKMKTHPLGKSAAVIGEVTGDGGREKGMVLLKTAIGGIRIIDMLAGEQLPRIC